MVDLIVGTWVRRGRALWPIFAAAILAEAVRAADWQVAKSGDDRNAGSAAAPFRTIQRAADAAQPGDTITVHAGVYRERVDPPRGGTSDSRRIVYRAAPGERVEITGSEIVKGWTRVQDDTWTVSLPNAFFGTFNPYADVIHGDWFDPRGRVHHTGAVYLNGEWLTEAARRDLVLRPADATPLWFGEVGPARTTLWAQFKDGDPNRERVEINVRQTVFYPSRIGRNFITVRGFILRDAATPWAPPTAEQIGLIGPHWSRGWIIEDNDIAYSTCSGVSLGKYGDAYDNTSAERAEGYVQTIERAQAFTIPWRGDLVGHHIVRDNVIAHCEQAGIVGSLGCAFSLVTGNVIHDIHVRALFGGAEMAGIKFHGAIDAEISHNHIYRCNRGIWLDWMAQGTRVSANLFHDNGPNEDLLMEVDHGPCLIDNNLFLSAASLFDVSEGGAFAHNLITGTITRRIELDRETPFLYPHATRIAGLARVQGGDDRFFNNVFVGRAAPAADQGAWVDQMPHAAGYGLAEYDGARAPLFAAGNVYANGAVPYDREIGAVRLARPIAWKLQLSGGHWRLFLSLPEKALRADTRLVTTETLGRAKEPGLPYENPDGTPLAVDRDYFGRTRSARHPTPGPFETSGPGRQVLEVW